MCIGGWVGGWVDGWVGGREWSASRWVSGWVGGWVGARVSTGIIHQVFGAHSCADVCVALEVTRCTRLLTRLSLAAHDVLVRLRLIVRPTATTATAATAAAAATRGWRKANTRSHAWCELNRCLCLSVDVPSCVCVCVCVCVCLSVWEGREVLSQHITVHEMSSKTSECSFRVAVLVTSVSPPLSSTLSLSFYPVLWRRNNFANLSTEVYTQCRCVCEGWWGMHAARWSRTPMQQHTGKQNNISRSHFVHEDAAVQPKLVLVGIGPACGGPHVCDGTHLRPWRQCVSSCKEGGREWGSLMMRLLQARLQRSQHTDTHACSPQTTSSHTCATASRHHLDHPCGTPEVVFGQGPAKGRSGRLKVAQGRALHDSQWPCRCCSAWCEFEIVTSDGTR
jgi:hypothetical protein